MANTASADLFSFDCYLTRVGLTRDELASLAELSHELLHCLMWAQATHIPWENLATHDPENRRVLHPSSERAVWEAEHDVPVKVRTSIQPDDVYHKLVTSRRGGYCYEHNLLLARALREVGFDVTPVGARGVNRAVEPSGESGFPLHASTHLVLVTTTSDGARYLVDDGYVWAGAPRTPLALAHGVETVDPNTREVFRLMRAGAHPSFKPGYEKWGPYMLTSAAPGATVRQSTSDERTGSSEEWYLQYKPSPEAIEFSDVFHFDAAAPTTLTDCLTGAWYATSSPYHRQPHLRLAAIMTEDGRISLVDDVVTIRRGGRVAEEATVASDTEMRAVLARHFGIA